MKLKGIFKKKESRNNYLARCNISRKKKQDTNNHEYTKDKIYYNIL